MAITSETTTLQHPTTLCAQLMRNRTAASTRYQLVALERLGVLRKCIPMFSVEFGGVSL
jgi:hypothetical protein